MIEESRLWVAAEARRRTSRPSLLGNKDEHCLASGLELVAPTALYTTRSFASQCLYDALPLAELLSPPLGPSHFPVCLLGLHSSPHCDAAVNALDPYSL